MADHGMGPYAWIKDAADESFRVGQYFADALSGFERLIGVSAALEKCFAAWVNKFEGNAFDPVFDWLDFHRRGLELSRRLKLEIGATFRVVYCKPHEDPNREAFGPAKIEILVD
jgi:hypothetical protein